MEDLAEISIVGLFSLVPLFLNPTKNKTISSCSRFLHSKLLFRDGHLDEFGDAATPYKVNQQ